MEKSGQSDARDTAEQGEEPFAGSYEGLTGRAPAMIELYKEIARVAPSRSTVLIYGESGTGKELVARSLHKHSPRAAEPFIAVNCGALTETLLEAELFGHVRGSFTGAVSDRKGLWEEAGDGTLFLDEIGETSPAMQVKLLRALQEGEIRRVGASRAVRVNARVVAATNRNLEKEVRAGNFREDLFYRLSVVTLGVPPLRERRSDIPLLAERFLSRASESVGRRLRFSEGARLSFVSYDWPGNVRELENAVEYAALHARGQEVQPEDLPAKMQTGELRSRALLHHSPLTALYADLVSLDELERRYLIHVLEATGGNRTRAAEILGIDRRTLYRMAERFQIKLDEKREEADR
jgi:transcriptional regulator with GAF, ATPase, and Fis domain